MASSVLERLLKKQQQIEARIKLLKARDTTQQRKNETRKKILVGAYYLEKAQKEGTLGHIAQEMDGFLKRPQDRVLFGLEVQEEDLKATEGKKTTQ